MTRLLAGVVLVAALSAGCTGGHAGPVSPAQARAQPTAPVPAVDPCPPAGSPGVSGHTTALGQRILPCLKPGPAIDLSRLGGGRPVLVNLWASWCLPCQREMPRLEQTYRTYRGRLLVLGVDTEDDPDSARSFLTAVHATYPQVVDADGALRIQLHAVGLPVTVLIRPDGSVGYRRLGELHPADLRAALTAAGLSTG